MYELKQSEIAERLGVANTYLSDVINGRVPLSHKMIGRLPEVFHINEAWLEEGIVPVMPNAAVVMELASTCDGYLKGLDGVKPDTVGYERIIRALEVTITAKNETIASQRCAIEVLKE
ncbi:MAG: helix-turn-helix domain-containing protein [Prevotellaceae bacterium]|nr:helix-turn-helix domain-containing protein [Prevotellaceae bacterium]